MDLTKENYFEFGMGDWTNPVVNASSLRYIYPQDGGSEKKYKAYLLSDRSVDNRLTYLENGRKFHKYWEDPQFYVDALSEEDLPEPGHVKIWDAVYEKLRITNTDDPRVSNNLLLAAANEIGWQGRWKDETRLSKLRETEFYFKFLWENTGRFMITASTKEIVANMVKSFEDEGFDDALKNGEKEVVLAGTYQCQDGTIINLKGMIDNLFINGNNYHIRDIKTTSDSVQSFRGKLYPKYKNLPSLSIIEPGGYELSGGAFLKYKLYRQLAFYNMLVQQNYENAITTNTLYVVETRAPFEAVSFQVTREWIDFGITEIKDIFENHIGPYIKKYGDDSF